MAASFNMRKIFVVGGNIEYASWMDGELVNTMDNADLVVFTGGVDIESVIYGERPHPMTEAPNRARDQYEISESLKAQRLGKHQLGICRGAQLICVMAGGRLVQHQENVGGHDIQITTGIYPGQPKAVYCAADHHQAAFPWTIKRFKVLGYTNGLLDYHFDGNGKEMVLVDAPWGGIEVEDVYYPDIKALGIQCHPEWEPLDSPAVAHYRKLLDLHMNNAL